jgi:hypothetical protein
LRGRGQRSWISTIVDARAGMQGRQASWTRGMKGGEGGFCAHGWVSGWGGRGERRQRAPRTGAGSRRGTEVSESGETRGSGRGKRRRGREDGEHGHLGGAWNRRHRGTTASRGTVKQMWTPTIESYRVVEIYYQIKFVFYVNHYDHVTKRKKETMGLRPCYFTCATNEFPGSLLYMN